MFAGLLLMIGSEVGTLAHIEPFWSWNTPIAWTGFILFADAIVFSRRGDSWLRTSPQEFAFLSLVSIPLWLVFEFYNLFLHNWYYTGLPENFALRMFGYAWSFSTIWPAIFEGAELVSVLRTGEAGRTGAPGNGGAELLPPRPSRLSRPSRPTLAALLLGAVLLIVPFVVSTSVAAYLAAPVWLGFIFLLDPVNARLGEPSLTGDFAAGRTDRLVNLVVSGFLCGFLWEFWNYWSRAKWHYTVPIMEHTKLFEMPLPGFLGFPAFALECFTMYAFVRAVVGLRGRPIAL